MHGEMGVVVIQCTCVRDELVVVEVQCTYVHDEVGGVVA